MMMWRLRHIVLALSVVSLVMASCRKEEVPYEGEYSSVAVYYALGFNNLSSNLKGNFNDLVNGWLPPVSSDKALLAFCHNTAESSNYVKSNSPVLVRLYTRDGATCVDTLKTYPADMVSASPSTLSEVLSDVREMFPSKGYGMVFSSHATGWIPSGYRVNSESSVWDVDPQGAVEQPDGEYPLTKSIGAQYYRLPGSPTTYAYEMDVRDFVDAVPMKLDYVVMDACLLGGVEVAWDFKDVCDRIVFSPTEVLAQGLIYSTMAQRLLRGGSADLQGVCRDYFSYYLAQSGSRQSATISLVDCSALEELAEVYAGIVESCRAGFDSVDRGDVQAYFYDSKSWYYDLRDAAAHAGANNTQLDLLDEVLGKVVLYHDETPYFFKLPLDRCCGLSTYLPDPSRTRLNEYYRNLSWNKAVGLLK